MLRQRYPERRDILLHICPRLLPEYSFAPPSCGSEGLCRRAKHRHSDTRTLAHILYVAVLSHRGPSAFSSERAVFLGKFAGKSFPQCDMCSTVYFGCLMSGRVFRFSFGADRSEPSAGLAPSPAPNEDQNIFTKIIYIHGQHQRH